MFITAYAYTSFHNSSFYSLAGTSTTGSFSGSANADGYVTVMPQAGTFKNLYVTVAITPPGASQSWTIYKNGSSTGIVVTIPNGQTTGNDTTHNFTAAIGDRISIGGSSATGTLGACTWAIEFDPS